MAPAIIRFMVGALLVSGLGACTKSPQLTAATIYGRAVAEKDLPELAKVVEASQSRFALWNEEIPRDSITIEVNHSKHGQLRYFYSPSKKAIFWLDDPKHRKFGCAVSGHSALTIEKCFRNGE